MTPNPNIAKCKACGGDGDAKSGPAEGTLCRACGGSGYVRPAVNDGWPTIDEARKRATQLIENGLPDCRPSQPKDVLERDDYYEPAIAKGGNLPASQPPFTNVDSLGRGDHNPPIGALGDAIASLRPKSVAKRIAAQKGEPYPFEAQPVGEQAQPLPATSCPECPLGPGAPCNEQCNAIPAQQEVRLPRCENDPSTCRCAECRRNNSASIDPRDALRSRLAAVEAERDRMQQGFNDACATIIDRDAQLALQAEKVGRMRVALRKFGYHSRECSNDRYRQGAIGAALTCACGYDAALKDA